jgi:hypothetical protein
MQRHRVAKLIGPAELDVDPGENLDGFLRELGRVA